MSEETEQPHPDDRHDDEGSHGQGPAPSEGTTGAVTDDPEDLLSDMDLDPDTAEKIRAAVEANRSMLGTLTLHLEGRDIDVSMDGDAALRLLKMFELRDGQALVDHLNPFRFEAGAGWFVLDLDEAKAMSWTPGSVPVPRRTTVDPAPPLAA